MLLAYLRGELKPTYSQGMRSMLRESLILEALSSELDVKYLEGKVALNASFIPLLETKSAREMVHKQQLSLENLRHLSEFDDRMTGVNESIEEGDEADLRQLYESLEEAGLVGESAVDPEDPNTTD